MAIYELDPVDRIAVAAVGEPGQRRFFLLATGSGRTLTLGCEKSQLQALIVRVHQMLEAQQIEAPERAAERLLVDLPDVRVMGLLHGASNYTFLTRLGPHPPSGLRAVYKPARGESPLWDFEAGTLYQREVAAYELSKVLGWPRIPPTVVRRKAPHGIGAVQLFIEADGRHFLGANQAAAETWMQVALFDVIANNADRKSGHCLFDAQG